MAMKRMAPGKQDVPYDIRERSFLFGMRVIKWVRTLKRDWVMEISAKQLIRSATSIGANIEEVDGTETIKDKIYKWTIARKEARESRFWIRTLIADGFESPEAHALVQESTELINIISTLIKKNKDSIESDWPRPFSLGFWNLGFWDFLQEKICFQTPPSPLSVPAPWLKP